MNHLEKIIAQGKWKDADLYMQDLFPAYFISLISFLNLLPSMMIDSRARRSFTSSWNILKPRGIEEKNSISRNVPHRALFSPAPISPVDFRLTIVVNDGRVVLLCESECFRANREMFVFRCFDHRALPRSHARFVTRRCLASSFLSLFRRCYEQVRVTVSIPALVVDAFVGQ